MAKVGANKQPIKKSNPPTTKKTTQETSSTEQILVENSVALQKVMVDLAEKFTNLSGQISNLLNLFETSAKTMAEKGFEDNQQIVQKLDSLLEQNKVLARGIALLHEEEEEIEEDIPTNPQPPKQSPPTTPPMSPPNTFQRPNTPPRPPQPPQTQNPINIKEYQKSISTQ